MFKERYRFTTPQQHIKMCNNHIKGNRNIGKDDKERQGVRIKKKNKRSKSARKRKRQANRRMVEVFNDEIFINSDR